MFKFLKEHKLPVVITTLFVLSAIFNDGRRPSKLGWLYDLLGPTDFIWTMRGFAVLIVFGIILAARSIIPADRRIERFVDQKARLEPEKRIEQYGGDDKTEG